jgi:hypothetical protein
VLLPNARAPQWSRGGGRQPRRGWAAAPPAWRSGYGHGALWCDGRRSGRLRSPGIPHPRHAHRVVGHESRDDRSASGCVSRRRAMASSLSTGRAANASTNNEMTSCLVLRSSPAVTSCLSWPNLVVNRRI